MNEIYVRLKVIKHEKTYDVCFDRRLSFNENLRLLKKLVNIDGDNVIYDENIGIFLNMDIPLEKMNIECINMFTLL